MKKSLVPVLGLVLGFAILITPACKTFVWDPTGSWSVSFTVSLVSYSWTETMNFTGTADSGTVTGFVWGGIFPSQSGSYTKTGDYSLTMNVSFPWWGSQETGNFTGTSSEAAPNSMSGSGTWTEDSSSWSLTWNASKVSNLQ